jgi:hypothetical protein
MLNSRRIKIFGLPKRKSPSGIGVPKGLRVSCTTPCREAECRAVLVGQLKPYRAVLRSQGCCYKPKTNDTKPTPALPALWKTDPDPAARLE